MVEPGFVGNGFPGVFGRAGKLEGLGAMECCGEANFAGFFGMDLEGHGFSGRTLGSDRDGGIVRL